MSAQSAICIRGQEIIGSECLRQYSTDPLIQQKFEMSVWKMCPNPQFGYCVNLKVVVIMLNASNARLSSASNVVKRNTSTATTRLIIATDFRWFRLKSELTKFSSIQWSFNITTNKAFTPTFFNLIYRGYLVLLSAPCNVCLYSCATRFTTFTNWLLLILLLFPFCQTLWVGQSFFFPYQKGVGLDFYKESHPKWLYTNRFLSNLVQKVHNRKVLIHCEIWKPSIVNDTFC